MSPGLDYRGVWNLFPRSRAPGGAQGSGSDQFLTACVGQVTMSLNLNILASMNWDSILSQTNS